MIDSERFLGSITALRRLTQWSTYKSTPPLEIRLQALYLNQTPRSNLGGSFESPADLGTEDGRQMTEERKGNGLFATEDTEIAEESKK